MIPVSSKHEMVNPVFADFIAGAGEVYSKNGYDMLLSVVSDEAEADAYRQFKVKGNVMASSCMPPPDGRSAHCAAERAVPALRRARARLAGGCGLCWVDVNNTHAFERATNFLLDLGGHRRIVLVNGLETMDFAMRRRAGFAKAHEDRELTADPDLCFADEMTEAYGHDTARMLLAQGDAPTAFLVSSMITAIGVRRAVEELGGLRLGGRDISVITHDDELSYFRNGGADVPVYTATRSSVREAGRRAATMLLDIIRGGSGPRQILLEADLTLGQSTGPAPPDVGRD